MKPNRPLVAAALLLALLMVFAALSEAFLSAWPLRWSETGWRVGTAVLLSRSLMTVLLAVLLAGGTALLRGHRLTLRLLAAAAALAGLALFAASGLFVLDSLELRGQVQPGARREFDAMTLQTLVRFGLAAAASVLLGIGGWRAARAGAVREQREQARGGSSLLIARAARESQA